MCGPDLTYSLSFCGLWIEAEISQPQIFLVEEEREGRA